MSGELGDFGIVVAGSFALRCVVIGSFESLTLIARDLAAECCGNKQNARVHPLVSCPMAIVIRCGPRREKLAFRVFGGFLVLDHGCDPGGEHASRQTQVGEAEKHDHFAKAKKDNVGRRWNSKLTRGETEHDVLAISRNTTGLMADHA